MTTGDERLDSERVTVLRVTIDVAKSAVSQGRTVKDVVDELQSLQRSGGLFPFAYQNDSEGPRHLMVKVQYLEFKDAKNATVDSSSPRVTQCHVISESLSSTTEAPGE